MIHTVAKCNINIKTCSTWFWFSFIMVNRDSIHLLVSRKARRWEISVGYFVKTPVILAHMNMNRFPTSCGEQNIWASERFNDHQFKLQLSIAHDLTFRAESCDVSFSFSGCQSSLISWFTNIKLQEHLKSSCVRKFVA